MFKHLRESIEWIRRESARKYLHSHAQGLVNRYPQMVCYSFDFIATDINIDGRYDQAELDFLEKMLTGRSAGKTILDVGANIGNHALAFSNLATRVIAFEPHPRTVQLLRLNTEHRPNVEIVALGASDRAETVRALSSGVNLGASTITDRPAGEGEISWSFDVRPLDSLDWRNWGDIAVVKIDVEGHEPHAIRGATKLLEANRPIVLLEQNPEAIHDGTSESLELLRTIGYRHFATLVNELPWRTPQRLPRALRQAGRLAESALFGPPTEAVRLVPVQRLENRNYNVLIASFDPIEAV